MVTPPQGVIRKVDEGATGCGVRLSGVSLD
jgi:hypothetical protein